MQSEKRTAESQPICWKTVSSVFIVFGLMGLFTSWIFGFYKDKLIFSHSYYPVDMSVDMPRLGPIQTSKKNETVRLEIAANQQSQSWTFLHGEVQDERGKYLFSFGEELWHESGYDSDGAWTDYKRSYDINITFPEPGKYYLKFDYESAASTSSSLSNQVSEIGVRVFKKIGSAIPHFVFGLFTLLIGIAGQCYARRHQIAEYIENAENSHAYKERARFHTRNNMHIKRQDISLKE